MVTDKEGAGLPLQSRTFSTGHIMEDKAQLITLIISRHSVDIKEVKQINPELKQSVSHICLCHSSNYPLHGGTMFSLRTCDRGNRLHERISIS